MGNVGVYAISNRLDGKVYVGRSTNIQSRWRSHRFLLTRGQHANPHLQAAWKKYGEGAFEFTVLEEVLDESTLPDRESHHIAALDSCAAAKGYNLKHPDDCGIVRHSEATKARMSLAQRNRDPEINKKIGLAHKGRVPSASTRDKLRVLLAGKPWSPARRAAQPVSPPERIRRPGPTRISYRWFVRATEAGLRQLGGHLVWALTGLMPRKPATRPRGYHLTPEHRARISAAEQGRQFSPEHRAKLAAAKRGRQVPPEVKAKIAATLKAKAAGVE